MYYQIIYYIQNADERNSSHEYKEYPNNWFDRHLAFDLTSGGIRTFSQDINFSVVRDDSHGFEIIVAYPDHLIPRKPILYSILQEIEAGFDVKFYNKPTCYENIHLHQISTVEFLTRLSQSTNPLLNVLTLINEPHVKHYEEMESNYKLALKALNEQQMTKDTEKEIHVL